MGKPFKVVGHVLPEGTCLRCDKFWYATRKLAKAYLRQNPHKDGRVGVYRCPGHDDRWHIGHIAPSILMGVIDRSGAYGIQRQHTRGDTVTTFTTENTDYRTTGQEASTNGRTQGDNMLMNTLFDRLFTDLDTYRFEKQIPVTPSLAARLIGLNVDNQRNLKPSKRDQYRRDMEQKHWREQTGQTIKISKSGRLLDGNHRMHAVQASGKTIVFDLVFGVDEADLPVIDAGAQRSTADVIRTAGGVDVNRVQAIVRWVWAWKRGARTGPGGIHVPTPLEIEETYLHDRDLFDAATARGRDCQARGIVAARIAGTAYFLMATVAKPEADDMFDALISGLYGMPDPSNLATYKLRERLIGRKTKRLTPQEQLALFAAAWNRRHETVYRLQTPRETGNGNLTNANFPDFK